MRRRLSAAVSVLVYCCLTRPCCAQSVSSDEVSERASDLGGASLSIASVPSPHFSYVGTFTRVGRFRDASSLSCYKEMAEDNPNALDPAMRGAPPWMLRNAERTIPDLEAATHKTAVAPHRSRLSGFVDPVVQTAYGNVFVLQLPKYLAMDSQHRLIISDPADNAVHVLDGRGKDSFRIPAGPGYRLKSPQGVAGDRQGNIYVVDQQSGLVFIYDARGTFLRKVGTFRGEPVMLQPTAIAVDNDRGRIYVADTPRNVVVVFDLQGHYLRQLGKGRNRQGEPEMDRPTSIAVDERGVVVLDSGGARVWLMDPLGHPIKSLNVSKYLQGPDEGDSIALDRDGNIYATSASGCSVVALTRAGEKFAEFGRQGWSRGEFRHPMGLWIDGAQRIYVADSYNARVQVFQVSRNAAAGEAR